MTSAASDSTEVLLAMLARDTAAIADATVLKALEARCKAAGRAREQLRREVPAHLREVYTLPSVWSAAECARVKAAVERAVVKLGGWSTARHRAYATTDLPCKCVPEVDEWVRGSLLERVLAPLARRHGCECNGLSTVMPSLS
jgi:hypothetical protein